jgi:membrane associated rhomboid family serine protease
MSGAPTCPYCKSANVVRASVVYEQGTSTSVSRSFGVGAATGGAGFGASRSRGVSVSLAAQKNAPPKPSQVPATVGGLVTMAVWWLGYTFVHVHGTWWAAPVVGFVLGVVVAVYITGKMRPAENASRAAWANLWYCNQCGDQFRPN